MFLEVVSDAEGCKTTRQTDIRHHKTHHTYLCLLWHTVFLVLLLTVVGVPVLPAPVALSVPDMWIRGRGRSFGASNFYQDTP